jgi:DNA-binding IclR family transcriptional regulator
MKMNKNEPYTGTQSVLRAVTMLEAFTDEKPAWHVSDLADEVGLNRTTTYRLLTALESAEYVVRDPATDSYRLGSGLIVLGGRAQRANSVRAVSRPELEKLAAVTGDTATLEVLAGREVVIIEEIAGEYLTSGKQEIGMRWPAHATSTGKATLAHLALATLETFLSEPLAAYTRHTITDPAELCRDLDKARVAGYAVAAEELELGYVAVGAAVRDGEENVSAAISVGGAKVRFTAGRIREVGSLLRAAADRISYQLGYRIPVENGD